MIVITVNNQKQQISKQLSLEQFLNSKKIASNGIAVAINQNIIAKNNWQTTYLNNNDSILIIQATQGG